jgi:hypothetical protein
MLRFAARHWAKIRYIFNQETEAHANELNARLALQNAAEKRALVSLLTSQADEMVARIKQMDAQLEKGFWECENGHETDATSGNTVDNAGQVPLCDCGVAKKLIKRSDMTGQEKYEFDKERSEAEKLMQAKRDEAKAADDDAANSEKTAKYFQGIAQSNRALANKIRNL